MTIWTNAAVSVISWFDGPSSSTTPQASTEHLRRLMLDALGGDLVSSNVRLARRIRYAPDNRTLWDLRGDLMVALAAMHGERAARDTLLQLSKEFEGLLPGGLANRRSPLA